MANLQLPGNPRYQPADLREIFGYDNLYRPVGEVELAALDVLAEIGVIPAEDFVRLTPEIREAILAISTTDVDRVEREVTGHDIRAWVRLAQDLLPPELRRWAHIPLTSYDPLDTARALQFSRAHAQVVRPKAAQVALILADLTERFSEQIQVGRTHGQHALPVTVGFWFATVLNRIMENVRIMDLHASSLTGKVSGAVGAYNAQMALGITREGEASFEERVLGKLGLVPGRISTQIVQPEPLVHYLFSCVTLSAAFGQFGRDARHLMRTEIAEVREQFQEGQVGSSTMAHKRNPINFESLEGMWLRTRKEFLGVTDTLISEHQRDLVGSSLMRDFPIIVVNLTQQLNTLLRKGKEDPRPFLERLIIDPEACERNFALSSGVILAEPLYLALQMAGYEGDAHGFVNDKAMPLSQKKGILLIEATEELARDNAEVRAALEAIPGDVRRLFAYPHEYTGKARDKALEVARAAREFFEAA